MCQAVEIVVATMEEEGCFESWQIKSKVLLHIQLVIHTAPSHPCCPTPMLPRTPTAPPPAAHPHVPPPLLPYPHAPHPLLPHPLLPHPQLPHPHAALSPFLLVFHLMKGSVVGEWGEREGEAERVVSRAGLSRG